MNFDWDAAKAERNKAKHGVSFNIATRVFFDLGRIEMYDGRDGVSSRNGKICTLSLVGHS